MKYFNIESNRDAILLAHINYMINEGFITFIELSVEDYTHHVLKSILCKLERPLEDLKYHFEAIPGFGEMFDLICDEQNKFRIAYDTVGESDNQLISCYKPDNFGFIEEEFITRVTRQSIQREFDTWWASYVAASSLKT